MFLVLCSNDSVFLVLCFKSQRVPSALFQMTACSWCSVSNDSMYLVLCFKWSVYLVLCFKWQHVPSALFKWQHVPSAVFQIIAMFLVLCVCTWWSLLNKNKFPVVCFKYCSSLFLVLWILSDNRFLVLWWLIQTQACFWCSHVPFQMTACTLFVNPLWVIRLSVPDGRKSLFQMPEYQYLRWQSVTISTGKKYCHCFRWQCVPGALVQGREPPACLQLWRQVRI